MWTYIPEYLRYGWCYIQMLWVLYAAPYFKPRNQGVSSDTEED